MSKSHRKKTSKLQEKQESAEIFKVKMNECFSLHFIVLQEIKTCYTCSVLKRAATGP